MGGCDISKNPTSSITEIDQWNPSQDIPFNRLKKTSIWQKFNYTLNFELIRIEAFQKPVEWHITKLSNCCEYFSNELAGCAKVQEKEELEKFRDLFQRRIKYLQHNERAIDYLIQKGFKFSDYDFKIEEVNLNNIWMELYPIGYYFRFDEEDQSFNDENCLKLLSGLDCFPNVKEQLKLLLQRNLPYNSITHLLYHSLLEYYSLPFENILERSVALYHIHQICCNLLSTIIENNADNDIHADTPMYQSEPSRSLPFSSPHCNFAHADDDPFPDAHSCEQQKINISNSLDTDSDSVDENDISSDDSDTISDIDSGDTFSFTEKQRSLIEELKQHSLNKSSYLLQIKRSIRMEHKRNFNLAGERRKRKDNQTQLNPPLSLLSLTNNLHVGESIDSLDPGHRCIYRKFYHIYKHSIESDLMNYLTRSPLEPRSHHHRHAHCYPSHSNLINRTHSVPSTPDHLSPSLNTLPHLPLSSSSPSYLVVPSPSSNSIYCSSPQYKHIPFFKWLEGKDLEGVKKEKYYQWDLIPSHSMKVSFRDGFAYHSLFKNNSSLCDDMVDDDGSSDNCEDNNLSDHHRHHNGEKRRRGIILNGVYIYAVDENDDLYVLPKVPEDERERRELDLTALNIIKHHYPDYLLFPNHPRLIHSANGRSLGEISFVNGKIKQISNVSGHYRPHGYQFYLAVIALCKNGEIFSDDAEVLYRHSAGTDVFSLTQFMQLDRHEMMLDVIKGKDRPTGLEYHVKCNCSL